jgi:hypothetical protein
MKRVTLREYLHNPTANSSLSYIVPNRQQTILERVSLASSYRVNVINSGTGTMEGVRYESLRGLAMTGQQYFGGLFHQVKGSPGDVLDYVRVSIFYGARSKRARRQARSQEGHASRPFEEWEGRT